MPVTKSLSARSLQYYAIARKWASDIDFFKFECAFLHQLIRSNSLHVTREHPVRQLTELVDQLHQIDADLENTEQLLNDQTRQLELMAEDIVPEDAEQLAGKQVQLEYRIAALTAAFRRVKKDLYKLLTDTMNEYKFMAG